MRKLLAIVVLAVLAALPTHGEDRPGEKYISAIAAVEDLELRSRCVKAAVALDRWSKRLKIQNWDIELICGEYTKMPGAYGATEIYQNSLKANMWINVQADRDSEEVVIHELLHLLFREVIGSPLGEERATWTLSSLLFEGRRAIK